MQCGFVRIMRVLCLVVLPMCAVQAVAAANNAARAFAGYYELSNVVEENGQVQVTMTLTLMNPSKTIVTGGIVAVLSSGPSPVLIGSFRPIRTLPAASRVTVSRTLTITAAEYASWQHGHAPRLQFLVSSGGTAVAAGIQAYQFVPPSKGTE